MRITFVFSCVIAISITITSIPSFAKQPSNVEITPLIGYRFGGDFDSARNKNQHKITLSEETSYGLLTAWLFDRKRQGEFLISHYNTSFSTADDFTVSNTGLGITYAHLGGNVPILEEPVLIYAIGGLGLTHFSPKDEQLSDETRFSVNVGLAAKIKLSERVSIRLDSRVYATFFNADNTMFCDVATCSIFISSDIWFQSEVSVGITYRFLALT